MIKKSAKDKKISEDEEKRSLEEIQKLTDDEIRRMEEMCRNKEREIAADLRRRGAVRRRR